MDKLTVIMKWIQDFDSVIGIIFAIPIFWTWWEVSFGRKRRHKRWWEKAIAGTGEMPAIFIVDILPGKSIETSVATYLGREETLKAIPKERIFKVNRDKMLTPGDVPNLIRDIRVQASEIIKAGVDVVHLFYAGPVAPTAFIGAEFANICKVLVYQHTQNGYENWGPLRHIYD